jgi:hypothetical protein
MGDVLGADRVLGAAALEGTAQRAIPVRLQQIVQALDIVKSRGPISRCACRSA